MNPTCIFNGCVNPALPSIDKCSFHRYRSKCKVDGCCNQVYARLLCVSHGGKKCCQHPSCTTPVRAGDYCSKHALRVQCSMCDEVAALQQTTCWRHGGGKICSVADCNRQTRVRDFCWQHRNRVLPPQHQEDQEPIWPDDEFNIDMVFEEWMITEPSLENIEIQPFTWEEPLDNVVPI